VLQRVNELTSGLSLEASKESLLSAVLKNFISVNVIDIKNNITVYFQSYFDLDLFDFLQKS